MIKPYGILVALLGMLQAGTAVSIPVSHCDLSGDAPGTGEYILTPVVSGLDRPTNLTPDPRDPDRNYVLEQPGRVRVIVRGKLQETPVLNIQSQVTVPDPAYDERGLLGIAFHPDFALNHRVFLDYTTRDPVYSHISEFAMADDGTIDPGSERIILQLDESKYPNHKGGTLAFGNDGYLYIGFGDGGLFGDPDNHGQDLRKRYAKILRIDVDGAKPYAIPPDNPFVGRDDALPEIWAYGLRNPWKFSFDRFTGDLWVADVGQDALEEIDLVEKGRNYGWPIMEGSSCYKPNVGCNQTGLQLPILEYTHDEGGDKGTAIIGGYVYYGTKLPSLKGEYVYGDWGSGKIWSVRVANRRAVGQRLLLQTGQVITSFGQGGDGELYVLMQTGEVYRLDPGSQSSASGGFPLTVSQTGCFKSLHPMVPADDVIPYEVNASLWSDGMDKDRFIHLPPGKRLKFDANEPWRLPPGGVLIKNFYVSASESGTGQRKILETRFLVRKAEGYLGYTYAWNDDQSDGTLLGVSTHRSISLDMGGSSSRLDYYYPTTSCLRCHNTAVGGVLGLRTAQISRPVQKDGRTMNQIDWLNREGIFDPETFPASLSDLSAWPDYHDPNIPVDERARAYLQVNCAQCHNSTTQAGLTPYDMRYGTSLPDTAMCGARQMYGDPILPGALVIKPGDPDRSVLYVRMSSLAEGLRMPLAVSHRVDEAGAELIRQWIAGMPDCSETRGRALH